jgi:hypothetical protein
MKTEWLNKTVLVHESCSDIPFHELTALSMIKLSYMGYGLVTSKQHRSKQSYNTENSQKAYPMEFREEIIRSSRTTDLPRLSIKKQLLVPETTKQSKSPHTENNGILSKPATIVNFLKSLFLLAFLLMSLLLHGQDSTIYAILGESTNLPESLIPDTLSNPGMEDTVLLMNGNYLTGHFISQENENISFLSISRDKQKLRSISSGNICDISFSNGSIQTFYLSDSASDNSMTRNQMHSYLMGKAFCKKEFSSPLVFAGGFIIGAVTPLISLWASPTIILYSLSVRSAPKAKPASNQYENIIYAQMRNQHFPELYSQFGLRKEISEFENNRLAYITDKKSDVEFERLYYFKEGYNAKAKMKKSMNALYGGLLGFLSTSLTLLILTR